MAGVETPPPRALPLPPSSASPRPIEPAPAPETIPLPSETVATDSSYPSEPPLELIRAVRDATTGAMGNCRRPDTCKITLSAG